MMPSHVFYSPGIYMNQTKHQHIICLSQSICEVGPVSAAAVFFVCFMSAVCCWRLPLMWAIQYQQEFWNGILSSLSGSVSGNPIPRDIYTIAICVDLINNIYIQYKQEFWNDQQSIHEWLFCLFVYRSSQCSQRFWLFKNKTKHNAMISPQYTHNISIGFWRIKQQFYIPVSSPLLMFTQRKRGNAATVILLLLQFDLFNNYLFIQFVQ